MDLNVGGQTTKAKKNEYALWYLIKHVALILLSSISGQFGSFSQVCGCFKNISFKLLNKKNKKRVKVRREHSTDIKIKIKKKSAPF